MSQNQFSLTQGETQTKAARRGNPPSSSRESASEKEGRVNEIVPTILFLDTPVSYASFEPLLGGVPVRTISRSERQTAETWLVESRTQDPLLLILPDCSPVSLGPKDLLELAGSHLFVRLLQVKQPWREPRADAVNFSLRYSQPLLPIDNFQLPEDAEQLEWEVASFVEQAKMLGDAFRRLFCFNSLNEKEHRLAQYVARGLPNKKISRLEKVVPKTIEKWRSRTYEKLEVRCAAELISLVTVRNFLRWPSDESLPH